MHSATNFNVGVSTPKLAAESLASIPSVQRQTFERLPSGKAVSSCAEQSQSVRLGGRLKSALRKTDMSGAKVFSSQKRLILPSDSVASHADEL